MSWQVTAWVIEHSKHKGSALLTLLCIANCANESGTDCWPSKERLAKDTRMSARQLGRIVGQLEASGELAVKRSSGRLSNHYSFPLMKPNPDKMTGLKAEANPDKSAPNPDISDANPDIAMSHDPSVRTINKNSQPKPRPTVPQLPVPFSTERFLTALADYDAHRNEMRKTLGATGRKRLLEKLTVFGEADATEALNTAVANGWTGVFRPDHRAGGNGNGHSNERPVWMAAEK